MAGDAFLEPQAVGRLALTVLTSGADWLLVYVCVSLYERACAWCVLNMCILIRVFYYVYLNVYFDMSILVRVF